MEFTLRPMEAKDLSLTLSWRNDPEVLRTALTPNVISYKEHEAMFLHNNAVKLVFEVNNEPAGYIQVSKYPDEPKGEWSFHMGSKHRGKGLSTIMLSTALYYLKNKEGYTEIDSVVKEGNILSLMLHTRLGFERTDDEKGELCNFRLVL